MEFEFISISLSFGQWPRKMRVRVLYVTWKHKSLFLSRKKKDNRDSTWLFSLFHICSVTHKKELLPYLHLQRNRAETAYGPKSVWVSSVCGVGVGVGMIVASWDPAVFCFCSSSVFSQSTLGMVGLERTNRGSKVKYLCSKSVYFSSVFFSSKARCYVTLIFF